LLLLHTGAARSGGLAGLRTPRRFWEDVSVAASWALAGSERGAAVLGIGSTPGQQRIDRYQQLFTAASDELGLRPWQFWRTVHIGRLLGLQPLAVRRSDDAGRSLILELGFRLLGGVAPFLGLWLGALLCLPVLLWLAWELAEAGYTLAAVAVPLLLACSPYFVESLSLPYSAVGFYVLTLVALVPFSVFAVAGPLDAGRRGLVLRTLAAGALFAIGAICRSGTLLLLPGFALALGLACLRRRSGRPWLVVVTSWLLLLALFLLPYLAVRRPSYHEAWLGVWEGLGDFDRSKGHAWFDAEAKRQLREAGRDAPAGRLLDPGPHEGFFRQKVLEDITGDPLWYATILAKRLLATVGLTRLAPYAPRDGRSLQAKESPQEGAMNVYYHLTTTVDFVGIGGWKAELPVVFLWGPSLLCVLLCCTAGRSERLRAARQHVAGGLAAAACVAAAALVSPVLITTASGIETEAFAVVHWLCCGLLLEALWRLRNRGATS